MQNSKNKKIAVFTSGGDAPGMNPAIRAVTRSCIEKKHEVLGFLNGYHGIIKNESLNMNLRSVANIIHRGGTMLKTSRCDEFEKPEGRQKAYDVLKSHDVSCLIGLGGDGTFRGLKTFHEEHQDIQVIGLPCTIDNDYEFSENTIGYFTAQQTAVEAIDKIRDTASSHHRTFVVEVMGRHSPNLAYEVAIGAGAESVVDLSKKGSLDKAVMKVKKSLEKGKLSSLIVALESEKDGSVSSAQCVQEKIAKELKIDCKSVVLGHIQRGGSPLSLDRVLASKMGFEASKHIGQRSGVIVVEHGDVVFRSFDELNEAPNLNKDHSEILEVLSN